MDFFSFPSEEQTVIVAKIFSSFLSASSVSVFNASRVKSNLTSRQQVSRLFFSPSFFSRMGLLPPLPLMILSFAHLFPPPITSKNCIHPFLRSYLFEQLLFRGVASCWTTAAKWEKKVNVSRMFAHSVMTSLFSVYRIVLALYSSPNYPTEPFAILAPENQRF